MYVNNKSIAMVINSNRKTHSGLMGLGHSVYKEYNFDKVLDVILFIHYVQFNGIYQTVTGIPMRGKASPFIADVYLS